MPKNKPIIYKNISMDDFKEKFDSIKGLDNKLEFISNYVLSYEYDKQKEDFELHDLVLLAKDKFLDEVIKEQNNYEATNNKKISKDIIDPKNQNNSKNETKYKLFLTNPMAYLGTRANAMAYDENFKIDENEEVNKKWHLTCLKNLVKIQTFMDNFDAYEKSKKPDRIRMNIANKLYNNKNLSSKDILDKNKGGFFERLFRRTSSRYIAFKNAFDDFNNKDSVYFGNKEHLEEEATYYLKHKFPSFRGNNDLPKEEDIERLSGTSKKRALFALNVIKSINEERRKEEITNKIEESGFYEDFVKDNKQQENFQNLIKKEIEGVSNDEAVLNDDSEIILENDDLNKSI